GLLWKGTPMHHHASHCTTVLLGLLLVGAILGCRSVETQRPTLAAEPQVPRMDTDTCEFHGTLASWAAIARDKGIPSSQFIANLRDVYLPQVTAQLRLSQADIKPVFTYMTDTILFVYAHHELNSDQAKFAAYRGCMR